MANPTGELKGGMPLGMRIFLATALLLVLAMATAVVITTFLGNRIGQKAVRETLDRSSSAQEIFQESKIEQLFLATVPVASDPNFVAYMLESAERDDIPSILDLLDERRDSLGASLAIILDPDGQVIARTDDPAANGEDLADDPLYGLAFDGEEAAGLWAQDEELFYAVATPLTSGGLLEGFLLVARLIDDGAANELRELNDTEVFYLLDGEGGPQPVAKTLSPGETSDLLAFLNANPQVLAAEAEEQHEVELQRQRWQARIRPLAGPFGDRLGSAVNLASLDLQLAPFQTISRILMAVGAIAVLLALALSYLLPKRVLQPMHRLTEAANAAADGHYDQEISIDRKDEVGQLAGAFSTLLSELREKRDMEIYVNELARSVPDPEGKAVEAIPASGRQVTLLGVELRSYVSSYGIQQEPHQALEHMTQDMRRLARSIQSQGGQVESILGHRLVASFEDHRSADRALSSAADILAHGATPSGSQAAIALATGPAVSGTITLENRPVLGLTGGSMEHLEALLRVARAGTLLISSSAHEELKATFDQAGIQPRQHRSSVSTVPLFSLDKEAAASFAAPEFSATQRMTDLDSSTGISVSSSRTLSSIGIGSVLGDRFEILSELGAGGMGVVYKAHDRTLNELVALKMLKQEMWGDSDRMERLKDELKLARKISHPNILRTYDFGEAGGYPFISMEFVRGVTLRQILDQSGRLPLTAGLRTSRQICKGLSAAHAQSVLHRDIKPENLIIEATGTVKLMDFGIARPVQRAKAQTQPGAIIGTPFYLAPEQLEGLEADERADIYSCGVVFYEIFTGNLPFPASSSLMEVITKKLKEAPTLPSVHWQGMPNKLESLILRCLERNREERYENVLELLQELETLRA